MVGIYASQPSVFGALLDDFMSINWETNSGLDYGEQLYTARGSQSAAVGSFLTD